MSQPTVAPRLRRRTGSQTAIGVVGLLLVGLAAIVLILRTAPTSKQPPPGPPRAFAPDSVWNRPLSPATPLSPMSSTYVAELRRQIAQSGTWINTTQFSVPVYVVGTDQPRVAVTLDTHGGSADLLAKALQQGVPIPPGAQPAAGTDRHMVVWQPATDMMWEFWGASDEKGQWHARWGGVMSNVSRNPGYFQNPSDWGATATSLPLLGGLIRVSDLRARHIDHALALAIPRAAANTFAFPAQRTDGVDPSTDAIPEGTRFRLDPRLDVQALPIPAVTKELALAAQRYGIIVRDQSGVVALYAEDPRPLGSNVYAGARGLLENQYPNNLLRYFPWSRLEVVKAPITRR